MLESVNIKKINVKKNYRKIGKNLYLYIIAEAFSLQLRRCYHVGKRPI